MPFFLPCVPLFSSAGSFSSSLSVFVLTVAHGPSWSPWARWAFTADLPTVMVCALLGLPGGIWQIVAELRWLANSEAVSSLSEVNVVSHTPSLGKFLPVYVVFVLLAKMGWDILRYKFNGRRSVIKALKYDSIRSVRSSGQHVCIGTLGKND